jgi:hypothetical protein
MESAGSGLASANAHSVTAVAPQPSLLEALLVPSSQALPPGQPGEDLQQEVGGCAVATLAENAQFTAMLQHLMQNEKPEASQASSVHGRARNANANSQAASLDRKPSTAQDAPLQTPFPGSVVFVAPPPTSADLPGKLVIPDVGDGPDPGPERAALAALPAEKSAGDHRYAEKEGPPAGRDSAQHPQAISLALPQLPGYGPGPSWGQVAAADPSEEAQPAPPEVPRVSARKGSKESKEEPELGRRAANAVSGPFGIQQPATPQENRLTHEPTLSRKEGAPAAAAEDPAVPGEAGNAAVHRLGVEAAPQMLAAAQLAFRARLVPWNAIELRPQQAQESASAPALKVQQADPNPEISVPLRRDADKNFPIVKPVESKAESRFEAHELAPAEASVLAQGSTPSEPPQPQASWSGRGATRSIRDDLEAYEPVDLRRSLQAPEARGTAVRDIRIAVNQADQKVELRVMERAGELHVAVRTPDSRLAADLRENLPALSSRLEQTGFRADGLVREADSPAGPHRREPQPAADSGTGDPGHRSRGFGDGQGGAHQQARHRGGERGIGFKVQEKGVCMVSFHAILSGSEYARNGNHASAAWGNGMNPKRTATTEIRRNVQAWRHPF